MFFLCLKSSNVFSAFMVKSKRIVIMAYETPSNLASETSSNSSHTPATLATFLLFNQAKLYKQTL